MFPLRDDFTIENGLLRIDNCDERRVYKSEDISCPKVVHICLIHPLKAQIFVYLMVYCKKKKRRLDTSNLHRIDT